LWEELDWAYTGVIDGHDVPGLRRALRQALGADRPVVVHIATVKPRRVLEVFIAAPPWSVLIGYWSR